jgi:hypothetical protein
MTHCRYCNRFRLVRLSGSGAWLLDCGHTYLPLHGEGQRWIAYTRGIRSNAGASVIDEQFRGSTAGGGTAPTTPKEVTTS